MKKFSWVLALVLLAVLAGASTMHPALCYDTADRPDAALPSGARKSDRLAGAAGAEEGKLPAQYDLREEQLIPSQVRNQGHWGLCWAFGTLASIESNYMKETRKNNLEFPAIPALYDPAGEDKNPHASELYLGYFTRMAEKGKEHLVFSVTSGDKKLLSMKDLEKNPRKIIKGAGWNVPTALLSRGFGYGPIPHKDLPYPTKQEDSELRKLFGKNPTDKSYQSVLWLTDVETLEYPDNPKDADFEKNRAAIINDVKTLLMKNGALALVYTDVDNSRNATWKTYFCSKADTARVKKANPDAVAGHVVAVVGWDDTILPASFDVKGREKPLMNGAWLIRNSWGDEDSEHDKGYFWLSYEQHAFFQSYIVESADKNIVCYDWDPLGWCSRWGRKGKDAYAVNIFKTGSQPVKLDRLCFYTIFYDNPVTLYVKADYGTTKPTKDTVALGTCIDENYTFSYPGYHTYFLGNKSMTIPANSYFSVAMKVDKKYEQPIAIETRVKGYSDYAEVFDGESFFSTDGTAWTDGTRTTLVDSESNISGVSPMNACIKAFVSSVQPDAGLDPQPEPTQEEQTIGGTPWFDRPEDTVDYARLEKANQPGVAQAAAVLTGRELSLYLLDNKGNPLAEGTEAKLNFLFLGTEASYDLYYVPEDDGETDDEGHDYGYAEQPGDEWVRQFYPAGYEPHAYVDDEGELYADYIKTVKVGANGLVALNASDISTATEGRSIPEGYYEIFYLASGDTIVGTLPIVEITAQTGSSKSSGGCDAGLGLAGLLAAAGLVASRTRKR